MPTYRIYRLDVAGHIVGAGSDVECADDDDAFNFACALVATGNHVEVWRGTKKVCCKPV